MISIFRLLSSDLRFLVAIYFSPKLISQKLLWSFQARFEASKKKKRLFFREHAPSPLRAIGGASTKSARRQGLYRPRIRCWRSCCAIVLREIAEGIPPPLTRQLRTSNSDLAPRSEFGPQIRTFSARSEFDNLRLC